MKVIGCDDDRIVCDPGENYGQEDLQVEKVAPQGKKENPKMNENNSSSSTRWPEPSQQPAQQLIITLIGAKLLQPTPVKLIRPYAVLQFDHTDSITETANSSSSSTTTTRNRPNRPLRHQSSSAIPTESTVCQLTQSSPSPIDQPIWNHVAIFDIFKPRSSLFISIYYNQPEPSIQDQTDQLLGYTIIDLVELLSPPVSHQKKEEKDELLDLIVDRQIDLLDHSGKITTGSINIKIQIKHTINSQLPTLESATKKISIDDFEIIKLIGEGSYGQVYRVRKKDTRRLYAMKTLEKRQILSPDPDTESGTGTGSEEEDRTQIKLERVLTERKILEQTRGCEFLVGLKFSFQTPENLNLVMDLKSGGELMSYMQRFGGRFQESWVTFYTAEILSGLKFLHSINIAYRDLKPENCLLDATGHVALCDFGLSKLDMNAQSTTKTFCGTTEYIAPEVLLENGYTRMVDFWALGVLIFEMSVGWTPFFSEDRALRYTLILESDIRTKFPKRGISEVTKEIILSLLERDPSKRLGSQGIETIESHGFFTGLDWEGLRSKRLTPPFKPRVESDASLSYSIDPIYSYGGRSSNSFHHGNRRNQRNSEEDNHQLDHLPSRVTLQSSSSSRPIHQSNYQYQNQHSRRSSVENKITGLPLSNQSFNHHQFFTTHLTHSPASSTTSTSILTNPLSLDDSSSHLNQPTLTPSNPTNATTTTNNHNHPLHFNPHNCFKGFTFSSRD
ncbi:hypothetical protein MJO29_002698 [Puccinia striiformis f. sp. tritici]|nr:hypothetical protein MJO29_002698 [Puccinia striiformis f. sp. tritici]